MRIQRKNAITIGEALIEMFKSSAASSSHNTRRIFMAWDEATGAGPFTTRKFYKEGIFYATLKSSVLASQLSMQKGAIIEKMNAILSGDPLFIKGDTHVGLVKELRIK